jgi:N-acylneuraminate cytidylyltransferase
LIVWSINTVKGIPYICDTMVSTDDSAIREVAKNTGALAPWLRPPELATDTASSEDVCLHALNWYENSIGKIDGLLLLQPTSPFRSRETVLRGIEIFNSHKYRPVIGVSPATSHPMQCFQIEGKTMRPFMNGEGLDMRSQDLPPAYVVNGAFYLIRPEDLRKWKSFVSDNMIPLVINDPKESIDIDTEWDWQVAEAMIKPLGKI